MALSYSFKLAVRSILREKWINMLSVTTIAAGLLFTAVTMLSIYNLEAVTARLPEKFSVMLYLKDNVSRQDIDNIMGAAGKDKAVEKVKFIPKDQALKELKSTLKDTEYVLEGLGENPLPDSIEIKFKSATIGPEVVKKITAALKNLRGVQEIEYGEKFLSSIYSIRTGMKTAGVLIVILMSAGMLFVCYSTVKILFYRKERDIETFKLLGATKGFIRAPFLFEGAFIGFFGGLLSMAGILMLYYMVILKFSLTFPLFQSLTFPVNLSFALPPAGLFIGVAGAAVAIGRIKY